MPLVSCGDLLFVRATIGGEDAGLFAFDTGAASPWFDQKLAERFKLRRLSRAPATAPSGPTSRPTRQPEVAEVPHFAVGPLALGNLFVFFNDQGVKRSLLRLDVFGVIGSDLMGERPFTIDYTSPTPTLVVHDPSTFKPPAGAARFDLDWQAYGYPAVRGSVGDAAGWFIFDTGRSGTLVLLTPPFLAAHRIDAPGIDVKTFVADGFKRVRYGRLESFSALGRTVRPVLAQLAREMLSGDEPTDQKYAGAVGVQFLRGGRFTLDRAGRALWAEWPAPPPLQRFLASLGDPGVADAGGETPLMKAATWRRADAVAALLDAGADVNVKSNLETTALMHAVAAGDAESVALLLAKKAHVNAQAALQSSTPLSLAITHRDQDVVKALLAGGADAQAVTRDGQTPLHLAAGARWNEAVELLLAAGAKVDAADRWGITPLMYAAAAGGDTVSPLLARGARVAQRTPQGDRPLHYAVSAPDAGSVRALLDAGAAVDDVNDKGLTPLMSAGGVGP